MLIKGAPSREAIVKRFWALCLDTHMKLALYKYAIIILIKCLVLENMQT